MVLLSLYITSFKLTAKMIGRFLNMHRNDTNGVQIMSKEYDKLGSVYILVNFEITRLC